jgi:hypothetical protein
MAKAFAMANSQWPMANQLEICEACDLPFAIRHSRLIAW